MSENGESGPVKCLRIVGTESLLPASLLEGAKQGIAAVISLDGRAIRAKTDLFGALAAAARLPDYFGYNWDALEECLCDLSWRPATAYTIVFQDASVFACAAPRDFVTFLEIVCRAADEWQRLGVAFGMVLVDDLLAEVQREMGSRFVAG